MQHLFGTFAENLCFHNINDNYLIPCSLSSRDCRDWSRKIFLRKFTNYIKPRFNDWFESGGNILENQGRGPPFWIDIWDKEAIQCTDFPGSDTHPRIWWANKKAKTIKKLEEPGFTKEKILWATRTKKRQRRLAEVKAKAITKRLNSSSKGLCAPTLESFSLVS